MKDRRGVHAPVRAARPAAVVTGLGWFLLYIAVLLGALHTVGTDPALYYKLQMRAEVLPSAGITETELREADDMLAAYLRGDPHALEGSLFSEDETAHMADCLNLFQLLRTAVLLSFVVGLAFIAVGIFAMHYRGRLACGIAALCVLLPVAAAALWACVDFTALFEAFHRLLFTNELWLMDPAVSLMIRICPESMFETMAAIIAAVTLIFMLLVNALHQFVFTKDRRQKNAGL